MEGPMSGLEGNKCPYCKTNLDAGLAISNFKQQAKAGDVTFCVCCTEWSVVGDDFRSRKPTPEEAFRFEVTLSEQFQKAKDLVRSIKQAPHPGSVERN